MIMRSYVLAACAISAACLAAPAFAGPVTIGVADGANGFPFSGMGTDYQQVYKGSLLGGGAVSLNSISFSSDLAFGGGVADGTWTFSLSTTSKAVGDLDAVMSNNVGADVTQIYSGSLADVYDGTSLTINFSSFQFNPTAGNLLLEITNSGNTYSGGPFYSTNGDAGDTYSRMYNFGSGTVGYGLVTTFGVNAQSAAPEPASWALMLGGFGAIGGAMRSRRKTAVSFS